MSLRSHLEFTAHGLSGEGAEAALQHLIERENRIAEHKLA